MDTLTEYQQPAINSNLPAIKVTPEEWAARRQAFNSWVNTQLKAGIDYGNIPGVDKPTLFKPGAEKIAQLYGCSPLAEITRRDQDPTTGYLYVEVTVRLVANETGNVVATGIGACSSYESRYRWRWEYTNTKPEEDGWQRHYNRWRRRIPNEDLIDTWNTVIKMAKKRALVDAALTLSGASELFTQDVEDIGPDQHQQPQPKGQDKMQRQHWTANEQAVTRFWSWVKDTLGLLPTEALTALGVSDLSGYAGSMAEAKAILEAYVPANK